MFSNQYRNNVIQGSIGVSSLTKYIVRQLKSNSHIYDEKTLFNELNMWISKINIPYRVWLREEEFSKYSSESGFSLIADLLYKSFNNE